MRIIRGLAAPGVRPVDWLQPAKSDLLGFPGEVVHDFGVQLYLVQIGQNPPSAKHWLGAGAGVYELREHGPGTTFRVVYWPRFDAAIYVLHCFQKKSHYKSETPARDIAMVKERLGIAKEDYDEYYAGKKK